MSIADTIAAKSDQLNADDLVGGPIVVRITGVTVKKGDEQPVAVALDGYRPFMPCKTMRRLMVSVWGPDEKAYVGRWLELYRDPKAKWAGTEVGGVRIAKMSHIDRAQTIMLAETKKSKAPWTVHPLRPPTQDAAPTEAARAQRTWQDALRPHVVARVGEAHADAALTFLWGTDGPAKGSGMPAAMATLDTINEGGARRAEWEAFIG